MHRVGPALVLSEIACAPFKAVHQSKIDDQGSLILSEFAGTAQEFTEARLCNPFDLDGVKNVLRQALQSPPEEQARRMSAMRATLKANTVHDWAGRFLKELD